MEDSLDNVYEAEIAAGVHNRDNSALRIKWVANLRKVVSRRCPTNKVGAPIATDIDLLGATAEERREALRLTLSPE